MVCPNLKTALAAVLVVAQILPATGLRRRAENHWVDIWGSMPQLVEYSNMPPVPFNQTGLVFQNATLRQTIFITQSAPTIRLVLSNAFGATDLPITSASIAVPLNGSAGASSIDPSSLAPVTWSGGHPNFTIPNGARVVSDPIAYPVTAQQVLTVNLYLATGQTTNDITGHPGSRTTSYYSPGNVTAVEDVATVNGTQSSEHWYFISAVEAYLPTALGTRAFAIVGDSITDGRESTDNGNNRWPDNVLRRLQAGGAANATTSTLTNSTTTSSSSSSSSSSFLEQHIAVINQAAGGNRVLYDGNGPNALGRIDRDVLAHSGVGYAMVFEGVNDIGTTATDAAAQHNVGTRLLAAYDQIVAVCHARHLPVFAATITPFGGDGQAYADPARERTRQRVNAWIRDAGRFDAVVDFDAVVRDPANHSMLNPLYDSGDHLHPNVLGYQVMANAFDLSLFDTFQDGVEEEI